MGTRRRSSSRWEASSLAISLLLLLSPSCKSASKSSAVLPSSPRTAPLQRDQRTAAAPSSIVAASTPTASTSAYLGTWRIRRFEKSALGGDLTRKYVMSQIGKALTLRDGEATFDRGLLWIAGPACERASLSWASAQEFEGHAWQALLPSDHPSKRHGDLLFLNVACGERERVFGCEVTNDGELVAYYDGYYFFLTRDTA